MKNRHWREVVAVFLAFVVIGVFRGLEAVATSVVMGISALILYGFYDRIKAKMLGEKRNGIRVQQMGR